MNKTARNSFNEPYICKQEWSEDTFCQCGEKGVVFSKNGGYTTAFFEAFPKKPKTFIRGEGETIELAELSAWNKLQGYINCKNHEFERGIYTNGHGICKHCGLFYKFAEPITKCCICSIITDYMIGDEDKYYCKKHSCNIPLNKRGEYFRKYKRFPRKFKKAIKIKFSLETNDKIKDIKVIKSTTPIVKGSNQKLVALFYRQYKKYLKS